MSLSRDDCCHPVLGRGGTRCMVRILARSTPSFGQLVDSRALLSIVRGMGRDVKDCSIVQLSYSTRVMIGDRICQNVFSLGDRKQGSSSSMDDHYRLFPYFSDSSCVCRGHCCHGF